MSTLNSCERPQNSCALLFTLTAGRQCNLTPQNALRIFGIQREARTVFGKTRKVQSGSGKKRDKAKRQSEDRQQDNNSLILQFFEDDGSQVKSFFFQVRVSLSGSAVCVSQVEILELFRTF